MKLMDEPLVLVESDFRFNIGSPVVVYSSGMMDREDRNEIAFFANQ